MDNQKQREAFKNQVSELNSFNLDEFTLSPFEWNAVDHEFYFLPTQLLWEAWQQAQKLAVPNGYILMPKDPNSKHAEAFWNNFLVEQPNAQTMYFAYKAMIEAQEQVND